MSKKSTRSPTGMPFARKSEIFGLHSIPVGTTPVSLKNRLFSGFSLTRCFSAAPVSGKTKKAALPPQKTKSVVHRQTDFKSVSAVLFCRYAFSLKNNKLQITHNLPIIIFFSPRTIVMQTQRENFL